VSRENRPGGGGKRRSGRKGKGNAKRMRMKGRGEKNEAGVEREKMEDMT